MLGEAVRASAKMAGYEVWSSGSQHDVANYIAMKRLNHAFGPHVVVNCAGVIPTRSTWPIAAIRTNALGPWVVNAVFTASRVVNVSTDCVFNGSDRQPYLHTQLPNATDLYGRTKAMGEATGCVNVRCSFIGLRHGLLAWLLSQPAGAIIDGWANALWSGGTVYDVADALVDQMLDVDPGTYHLADDRAVSKYGVLCRLVELFDLDIEVRPQHEPYINRALHPTHHLERRLERLVERRFAHAS